VFFPEVIPSVNARRAPGDQQQEKPDKKTQRSAVDPVVPGFRIVAHQQEIVVSLFFNY
jgi:hypothetical protein